MPGRCLTGSRPLSTRIESSEYSAGSLLAMGEGIVVGKRATTVWTYRCACHPGLDPISANLEVHVLFAGATPSGVVALRADGAMLATARWRRQASEVALRSGKAARA